MGSILAAVLIITALGFLFGYGLALAAKKLEVVRDERVAEIGAILPGINCGACGYPGCFGYAEAVVRKEAGVDRCSPGGAAAASGLGRIMGVGVTVSEPRVARVHCGGGDDTTQHKYRYNGLADCRSAAALAGGFLVCSEGCLGLGSCVRVCNFDAINIDGSGRLRINEEKCTACGLCVQACPKRLIELINKKKRTHVVCRSYERGQVCNKICKVSCIACTRCVKACKQNAIHIENNLAVIDYAACTSCGECAAVCARKCIAHYPSAANSTAGSAQT